MATTNSRGRGPSNGKIELYSPTYFGACALGGIIACGPTHTGIILFNFNILTMRRGQLD